MIQDCEFDDDEVNKKYIVCKVCAQKFASAKNSCCLGNQMMSIFKQQYIKGNRNEQLREIISLYLEEDNICNKHGFVFEFVVGNSLHCKKCLVEYFDKLQKQNSNISQTGFQQSHINSLEKIVLFNDAYLINLKKKEENRVEMDFQDALKAIQNNLNQQKEQVSQIEKQKQNLLKVYQDKLNENTDDVQILDKDQIEKLTELRKAFEIRLGAISQMKEDFHDFLHDDFCEELQIRQKIFGKSLTLKFLCCSLEQMLETIRALQQNQQK